VLRCVLTDVDYSGKMPGSIPAPDRKIVSRGKDAG
jgi:hypothetical protein